MEEIEYSLDEEDLISFSQYHAFHHPASKRRFRMQRFVYPLFYLLLFGSISLLRGGSFVVLITVISFAIGWVILFPALWKRRIRKNTLKAYGTGGNKALLGKHAIRVEEDGIAGTSDFGEGITRWAAIEKIEATDSHTFLYISAVTAIVIPKNGITGGDYNKFVSALRTRHAEATASE